MLRGTGSGRGLLFFERSAAFLEPFDFLALRADQQERFGERLLDALQARLFAFGPRRGKKSGPLGEDFRPSGTTASGPSQTPGAR